MNNEQIIFNKYPDGMPQDDTFKYEEIDTKIHKMVKYN